MRVNPRTVLLAALQEGPCGWSVLWQAIWTDTPRARALTDRHLCKLTRSKQVVRLPDGRYALRPRSGIIHPRGDVARLGGTITFWVHNDKHEIEVRPGDSAKAIADRIKEASGLAVAVGAAP